MPVEIYRLELPDQGLEIGLGTYNNPNYIYHESEVRRFMFETHNSTTRDETGFLKYPGGYDDFNIFNSNHFFAFQTLEKLENWFEEGDILNKIFEFDYKIVKYTVKKIIVGNSGKQCIFELKNIINKEILVYTNN